MSRLARNQATSRVRRGKRSMRLAGVLGVCFAVLFVSICFAANGDNAVIAALKKQNAQFYSLSCEFTQETRIPLFDSPVLSKGRMLFKRPDSVLWEYVSPMREGFAMQGLAGVRWRDERAKAEAFSVGTDPIGSIIIRQLIAWVTLDLERIEKEYSITVSGHLPPVLTLVPKREDIAGVVESLVVEFMPEGAAKSVTIAERQGGVTMIRFTDVRVNGPVPDEEFR